MGKFDQEKNAPVLGQRKPSERERECFILSGNSAVNHHLCHLEQTSKMCLQEKILLKIN